jgi:eukaryotic-like serine/threonine-protein kinase
MDGFLTLRKSFFEALVAASVVTGACYLPPLHLAERADRVLYDLWSQLTPTRPSTDVLIVDVDDAVAVETIAEIAEEGRATLLIATLPEPPSESVNRAALGPVEMPVGDSRLRRTDWLRGGHLWFRPDDIDGVVRHEAPRIDELDATPSLAFHAARLLEGETGRIEPVPVGTDAAGRRWLRFYPHQSFMQVRAADLVARPEQVADKIVIVGDHLPRYRTPVGELSAQALVAQALSGYRDRQWIDTGRFGSSVLWAAMLGLLFMLAIRPLATRQAWWTFAITAAAGSILAAGSAFVLGNYWLPITGPTVLLVSSAAFTAMRPWRSALPNLGHATELTRARELSANGMLHEAWLTYRNIPPTAALLGELYDVASLLETSGMMEQATDLFHRIAQVDGRFRDVGQRLVRSNREPATSADREDRRAPTTLGRYEIIELIGHGAAGNVYLGRDPKINRIVAIKAIEPSIEFDAADSEQASRRFLREAEAAGRLNHPNIVTIYDVGEADGFAYIAMEYLRGRRLSELALPETLLPVKNVLDLLSRAADALHYAHAQNVIHRDIKPANIMYDAVSDGLKITDFGIARLGDVVRTRTGIVLGTPAFMSPEQLEGKNVNGHTDLFSLGVTLYQLLTGHLPFRGVSMTKLMFAIANDPHEPVTAIRPDLPEVLNPIIDRALAKDPVARFETGADMAAALRTCAAQLV